MSLLGQQHSYSFFRKLKIHRRLLLIRFFFTKVPFSIFWKLSAITALLIYSFSAELEATAYKAPAPDDKFVEKKPDYEVSFVVKPVAESPATIPPLDTAQAEAKIIAKQSYEKWLSDNNRQKNYEPVKILNMPPTLNATEKTTLEALAINEKAELEKDILRTLAKIPNNVGKEVRLNEPKQSFSIDRAEAPTNLPPLEENRQEEKIFANGDDDVGLKVEIKKNPLRITEFYEQATNALHAEQYEVAITLYKKILEKRPFDDNALFGLAVAYQKNLQYEQAKDTYEKILKLDRKNSNAINNYLALVGEENPLSAIEEFKKLQKSNPSYAAIPAQIAMLYVKLGKLDEAAEYMSRAVTLEPGNLQFIYNLAIIFDKKGNNKFAAALYSQVLDLANNQANNLPDSLETIRQRKNYISSMAENK